MNTNETQQPPQVVQSELTDELGMVEPITMGDSDMHCAPECHYLEPDSERMCCGTCKRDGKELDYYDWYLAHCKSQCDEVA